MGATKKKKMASVSTLPLIPSVILIEILAKLPAKSLIRFRCVSKFFYSLTVDPLFANMHRSLSLTLPNRTSILITIKGQTSPAAFYTINFSEENQGKLQANRIRFLDNKITFGKGGLGSSSDGLICQVRNKNGNIIVCNISTRQRITLPRIQFQSDSCSTNAMLGFDSFAKRYKVLMSAKFLVDPRINEFNYKHWVFTLGVDESWREINSPQFSKFYPFDNSYPFYSNYSVYIDGVIYSYNWLCKDNDDYPNFEIGAFEVGAETLSMIPFPDEFSKWQDGPYYRDPGYFPKMSALVEVDGRLAMVLLCNTNIMSEEEVYVDVWTWEKAKEWKKLTIYIPLQLGSGIINNEDCLLLRVTTNRAGEIVILCIHSEHFSILVCDFKSEVWRKFEVGGVEDFPIVFPWKVSIYNIVDNVFSLE